MSVLTHLVSTKNKLVLSSYEKSSINTSITTLSTRLNSHFTTQIKEAFKFGSYTRGTILPRKADYRSDIDYMIVFDNSAGYKPQTFIDRLKKFAEKYYSSSQIKQSHPTVVLELNHIKFDLVPAYSNISWWNDVTYYIPATKMDYTDWMSTTPNDFNKTLTDKNSANLSLIKPMIRLVKYWNALNGHVFESYELEKSLVNKSYWSCYNLQDYFFSAINSFSSWNLPKHKKDKVQRAKDIVAKTLEYIDNNMPLSAESEIKKLIPKLI